MKKPYNTDPKKGVKHPYKKHVILDPFNNRNKIAEVAKGAKGVYIFEIMGKQLIYVGSSINLYNRVCSYFMPSILAQSNRRVLRYFSKYGFSNVKLTLFIMDPSCTWEQIIELEQYFIDLLSPVLNVDLVAGGYSGFHTPMSQEARDKLRKSRGTRIYIYDTKTKSLIHVSDAKQWLYSNLKIDHRTLDNCLLNGVLYLNRFYFSLEAIIEYPLESLISEQDLVSLVETCKSQLTPNQPASKKILAENFLYPELSCTYNSINELSKDLTVDRSTVRKHLTENNTKLYKKPVKIYSYRF